jgi:hypothetical protein
MFVWWGQELVNLYNDPYRSFLGIKHPAALGKSARQVWAEIWGQIGPRANAVLLRGESTYDEALLLLMGRHGYPEETYFTFSYSPLPADQGNVGGLFCAVTEETQRVIGERRLRLLREITAATAESRAPSQVCESAAQCLSKAGRDLPFTLIYLLDTEGKTLSKAAETGFTTAHPAGPASVSLDDASEFWPFRAVIESGRAVFVAELGSSQGEAYQNYRKTVPRLWPSLRPRLVGGEQRPDWRHGFKAEAWYWGFPVGLLAFAATLNIGAFFAALSAAMILFWVSSTFLLKESSSAERE